MGDREMEGRVLEVVAEGLRAGPGTVAWEEAVREVSGGAGGGGAAKGTGEKLGEMEMLLEVRRRLEMGRGWREIRAGEGFTRKLMGSLEGKATGGGGIALTSWIVGLAVAGVVCVGVWGLMGWGGGGKLEGLGGGGAKVEGGAAGVGGIAYSSPAVAWNFGGVWPEGTGVAGDLEMEAGAGGWKPKVASGRGGGVGSAAWLGLKGEAGRAVVVEVTLAASGRGAGRGGGGNGGAVVTQVFVSAAGELGGKMGTGPGGTEWAWQWDEGGMRVATATGEVVGVGAGAVPGSGGTVVVVLEMRGDEMVASVGGERVWSGAMGLGGGERKVGVRFLAKDEVRGEGVRVVGMRVFEAR